MDDQKNQEKKYGEIEFHRQPSRSDSAAITPPSNSAIFIHPARETARETRTVRQARHHQVTRFCGVLEKISQETKKDLDEVHAVELMEIDDSLERRP